MTHSSQPASRRASDDNPSERRFAALAVDDDPAYLAYISTVLRRLGIDVRNVSDGPAALEELQRRTYDLLLCDLQMPKWNGFETVGAVRNEEELRDIHIILLTATEDLATRVAALDSGCDDFLGKSATEQEIQATVRAALRLVANRHALRQQNRKLYDLATHDPLTGIPNRRSFETVAESLLASQARPLSLVLLDLDHFKQINDEVGHAEGDRVLCEVGRALEASTRPSDAIARYGGDEFAVLLPDASMAAARSAARRIARAIRKIHWTAGETRHSVCASSGAATALLAAGTLEQLFTAADKDLYRRKSVVNRKVARKKLRSA